MNEPRNKDKGTGWEKSYQVTPGHGYVTNVVFAQLAIPLLLATRSLATELR
jgi:hypothetical protein